MKQVIALCLGLITHVLVLAQGPRLVVQTGHSESVWSAAFSPDGSLLASGGADTSVKIWDVATGMELRSIKGHSNQVKAVKFSPDGRQLITNGYEGIIRIWDVASGELRGTIESGNGEFSAMALLPDGKSLVTSSKSSSPSQGIYVVKFWNLASGQILRSFDPGEGVQSLAVSPDGRTLATGGMDGTLKIMDINTLKERSVFLVESYRDIRALAFQPGGNLLAIGGSNLAVLLWDINEGKVKRTLMTQLTVESLMFSPDGKTLAAGIGDTPTLWDVESGDRLSRLNGHTKSVWSVAFSPDGQTLASTSSDKSIKVWSLNGEKSLRSFTGEVNFIEGVALTEHGKTLVTHDSWESLRTWDLSTGKDMRQITVSGAYRPFRTATASDDYLIGANDKGLITIYDLNGKIVRQLNEHWHTLGVMRVSEDGKLLASGASTGDTIVWRLEDGRKIAAFERSQLTAKEDAHAAAAISFAFSPDARYLAIGTNNEELNLFDIASGRRVFSKQIDGVGANLFFSQDGKTIFTGGYKIKVIDAKNGEILRSIGAENSKKLLLSPDGTKIWTAGENGTLSQWSLAEGRKIRNIDAHADEITSMVLLKDGRTLITGSNDSTVKLWDTNTGLALATLSAIGSKDWLVATPDGLFDGSPATYNKIIWRFSPALRDIAPIEAFFSDFYYPNLLSDLMRGKRPKASQNLAQKDRRQPVVRFLTAKGASTSSKTIDIEIQVSDAPAGARDLRLFRNGSLVKVWHGDVLAGKLQNVFKVTVPVVVGENQLTAYAFNKDNVKSTDAGLRVKGTSFFKRSGTAYVLAVGINRYANKDFDLKYAVADAEAFGGEWRNQQSNLRQFSEVEVKTLTDEQATKAGILNALNELSTKANPEDAVIIYFAGHGMAEASRFYLIPHDLGYTGGRNSIDDAGVRNLLARSISDLELEGVIEKIDAGHLLMVIDACNSGQALEAEEKRRGPMNSKGLAQLAFEKGMYILAAAQSFQAAQEASRLGHGFLTFALVEEGLKLAKADDAPKDGKVVVREWFDYAAQRVPLMQLDLMQETQRGRGLKLAFVQGDEAINDPALRNVQRPRAFYRREVEAEPLVIGKPN